MLNIENGNILIAAGFELQPLMPLSDFKDTFDITLWHIWQWDNEDHHICHRREYLFFDNTRIIIQAHFISRVLHGVDLSFIPSDNKENTRELQEKSWGRLLGKTHDLTNLYSFTWGVFCVTKDEIGLPILRVCYQ